MKTSTYESKKILGFLAAIIAVAVFLMVRNIELYPTVFADEYVHSKLSRLIPMSESTIPGYLFLKLYSTTNYCGDDFYGCAKLINVILFLSAAPFIFSICRKVANSNLSAITAFFAVIGPVNVYTAYFMPESFFFLSFWVFCWSLLRLSTSSKLHHWLLVGAVYGASALVKPHSIFFLPAIIVYIIYVFFREKRGLRWKAVVAVPAFVLGASLVKFLLGYLLAGEAGITIFGPFYGGFATTAASNTERYVELLRLAVESLRGHVLVMTLLYGLPITIALSAVVRTLAGKSNASQQETTQAVQFEKIVFLSLLVIVNLICVTALFTASVASSGPYETPYRLHMRYYNFALPLFYIIVAGAFSSGHPINNKYVRCIIGGAIAACAAYTIFINLVPYTPAFVDSPEIQGIHSGALTFQIVGGLLMLALVSWIASARVGNRLYLYLALPVFILISSRHIALEQNWRKTPDIYDQAGLFTKQYLSNNDISKLVIVGSQPAGLYRSLFYLDNPKASLQVISEDAGFDLSSLAPGQEWVLLIGDHKLSGAISFQLKQNGYTLAYMPGPGSNILDFKRAAWPGVIDDVNGLSSPEAWGAWSVANIVTFEFTMPLPQEFDLRLVAHAFGPNVGNEFEAYCGENVVKFSLNQKNEEKILRFVNPSRLNVIRIKVPKPTSPKALGLSADDRNLGIGFIKMVITPFKSNAGSNASS